MLRADDRTVTWAVRHAAWLYARFHKRVDTKQTPFQATQGKAYAKPILAFADCCHYRLEVALEQGKLAPRGQLGLWVGKEEHGPDHLLMTEFGVVKARAVRRLPEELQSDEIRSGVIPD